MNVFSPPYDFLDNIPFLYIAIFILRQGESEQGRGARERRES